jgi:hypothetical protein
MVDYRFETSALRASAGTEAALSTGPDGEEVDLLVTDAPVRFAFEVEPGRIRVRVENQGSEDLFLDPADASYVDGRGQEHRLFVFEHDPATEPTSRVPGHSTASLSLWPEGWHHGEHEGRPAVWRGDSPLDGESTIEETSSERALANRRQDVGRSFEIVLPVRIAGREVSYRFRFAVAELVARRTWWA